MKNESLSMFKQLKLLGMADAYQATIQDIECSEQRNLSKGTLAKYSLPVPQDVESLISPAH